MGPASSRIHFPEDELGTQEHEITDQEHTPLFRGPRTNECVAVSYRLSRQNVPLLLSSLSSLVSDLGDGGVSSKEGQKKKIVTHLLQILTAYSVRTVGMSDFREPPPLFGSPSRRRLC